VKTWLSREISFPRVFASLNCDLGSCYLVYFNCLRHFCSGHQSINCRQIHIWYKFKFPNFQAMCWNWTRDWDPVVKIRSLPLLEGYISMPALRSASQDWTHQMSTNASITHTKRRSTRAIPSNLNRSVTRYMLQGQQPSKCNSTSKSSPPAANIAPAEILLDIFSMLTPRDFDNARRTCSQWMRTSLNHRLLETCLKEQGGGTHGCKTAKCHASPG
jgi:hypothetical protein